jgi:hypothetical protein
MRAESELHHDEATGLDGAGTIETLENRCCR